MMFGVAALTLLALIAVSVHGTTNGEYPQIHLGSMLRNNSILDLSTLGTEVQDRIECRTDAVNCCSDQEGLADRAWYLPNRTKLFKDGVQEINSFVLNASAQQLSLQFTDTSARSVPALSGVYECSIGTTAGPWQGIYLGLYNEPEANPIEVQDMSFLGPASPPFSIQCTSINRPATTVEWELNNERIVDTESVSVLNDPVTAHYMHTLTVTDTGKGAYKCVVSTHNDRSMTDTQTASATLTVLVGGLPEDVVAFQETPTSVKVFWAPNKYNTIGYTVYYTGATSGNVSVDGIESNHMVVTELINGESYSFSVVGRSGHLDGEPVAAYQNPVSLLPGAPILTLVSTTADSATLHWTVPTGTVVTRYDLQWTVMGDSLPASTTEDSVPASTNTYTITGLSIRQNVTVHMRVIAFNGVGRNSSTPLIIHSSILQDSSEDSASVDVATFIGGAVGIFVASLVIGIVATLMLCALSQRRKKKSSTAATEHAHNIYYPTNGSSRSEPTTNANVAYNDPVTAQNSAYRSDTNSITYDYITDPPRQQT